MLDVDEGDVRIKRPETFALTQSYWGNTLTIDDDCITTMINEFKQAKQDAKIRSEKI